SRCPLPPPRAFACQRRSHHPPLPPSPTRRSSDLRGMSLSQATVTTIVDRLEARALIARRKASDDKRRVYASLTAEGDRVLANAPTALHTQLIDKFQRLENW